MPSEYSHLVSLRGDEAYKRYLDRLIKELKKRGTEIENYHRLADYALVALGLQLGGLKAPPRMPKHGAARDGAGRKPKIV